MLPAIQPHEAALTPYINRDAKKVCMPIKVQSCVIGSGEYKGVQYATAPAPNMDDVVCTHNFFWRKGTKPILQVTVTAHVGASLRLTRSLRNIFS
jgi:hypothetical protein